METKYGIVAGLSENDMVVLKENGELDETQEIIYELYQKLKIKFKESNNKLIEDVFKRIIEIDVDYAQFLNGGDQ